MSHEKREPKNRSERRAMNRKKKGGSPHMKLEFERRFG